MTIGETIKSYRKKLGFTQEELADRLGVTAPAVNKWERGHTLPDIKLLAPLARLLHISTDTLLSYRENPTNEEISLFIKKLDQKLQTAPYADAFSYAKEKLQAYPDCHRLIWNTAIVLEAHLLFQGIAERSIYDPQICAWFTQALESEEPFLKKSSAESLYHFYARKEQWDKAEEALSYFSENDPDKTIHLASLYSKTNRIHYAYRLYEQLLFTGFNRFKLILHALRILYMQEQDSDMAHKLADLEGGLAKLFEMGRYQEAEPGLELAAYEKNVKETERIMKTMLKHYDTLTDYTHSRLFRHILLKPQNPAFFERVRCGLIQGFLDEEKFGYMKETAFWKELKDRRTAPVSDSPSMEVISQDRFA